MMKTNKETEVIFMGRCLTELKQKWDIGHLFSKQILNLDFRD